MKKTFTLLAAIAVFAMYSCAAGHGCPSNGKNVGAERILSGDAKAAKAVKKAPKFRS